MTISGKKVLIVDDDNFLLDIYSVKFKERGADIHLAPSGADAIKAVRAGFVPDIIILDLVMPNMDGVEVLNTLRDERLVNGAVKIMLTNQSQQEDLERSTAAGAMGYIVKASMTPSQVLAEVEKIYEKYRVA